jgi:hypothetical protein
MSEYTPSRISCDNSTRIPESYPPLPLSPLKGSISLPKRESKSASPLRSGGLPWAPRCGGTFRRPLMRDCEVRELEVRRFEGSEDGGGGVEVRGWGAWSVRGFGAWDDDGGLRMPRNRSERGQGEGLMGEWPDDPGTGGWIARNEKPRMGVRGGVRQDSNRSRPDKGPAHDWPTKSGSVSNT